MLKWLNSFIKISTQNKEVVFLNIELRTMIYVNSVYLFYYASYKTDVYRVSDGFIISGTYFWLLDTK